MNHKSHRYLMVLIAVALMTLSIAAAQDDFDKDRLAGPPVWQAHPIWAQAESDVYSDSLWPPLPPPGDRGPRGMRGQMKYLEQFRILKLLEFLDIDEDQETEFITLFRAMRREQRDFDNRRRDLIDSLATEMESGSPDDDEILRLVEKVQHVQDRGRAAMAEYMDRIRVLLTPRQLGRAVIFQERFEQRLLEKLRGFHQRGRMQRGMPRDSGWRPDGGRPGNDR
jgi:Spy/CpxP family protein refolding chaperone